MDLVYPLQEGKNPPHKGTDPSQKESDPLRKGGDVLQKGKEPVQEEIDGPEEVVLNIQGYAIASRLPPILSREQ